LLGADAKHNIYRNRKYGMLKECGSPISSHFASSYPMASAPAGSPSWNFPSQLKLICWRSAPSVSKDNAKKRIVAQVKPCFHEINFEPSAITDPLPQAQQSRRPPAKPEAWQRWSGSKPRGPAGDGSCTGFSITPQIWQYGLTLRSACSTAHPPLAAGRQSHAPATGFYPNPIHTSTSS